LEGEGQEVSLCCTHGLHHSLTSDGLTINTYLLRKGDTIRVICEISDNFNGN